MGVAVKEARQARRLSRQALADLVDVSPRTIASIERGERPPQLATLRRIERELEISLDPASVTARDALGLAIRELRDRYDQLEPGDQLIYLGELIAWIRAWGGAAERRNA